MPALNLSAQKSFAANSPARDIHPGYFLAAACDHECSCLNSQTVHLFLVLEPTVPVRTSDGPCPIGRRHICSIRYLNDSNDLMRISFAGLLHGLAIKFSLKLNRKA
ncbi:hypothetical protein WOLCODRAFT_17784 [Wolfiporia cocos MD-104 SS10]|uniref:Uncharacterized protein n=1 Tax=Wolfiporia cocos (strain MD-104) TaxID=742152 RepID=A0A2H3K0I7_WOLCO|nr:hypothetical protein WOLCODRAFT_17784 [Wolfiporia cocos MD-104 SS10]